MEQHYAILYGAMLALPAAVGLWLLALPYCQGSFCPWPFSLSRRPRRRRLCYKPLPLACQLLCWCGLLFHFFMARQAHTEPMRAALWGLIANLGFALTLMPFLAIQGLALAISCAAWFQLAFLFFLLYRRGWITQVKKMLMMLAKMMVANPYHGGCVGADKECLTNQSS